LNFDDIISTILSPRSPARDRHLWALTAAPEAQYGVAAERHIEGISKMNRAPLEGILGSLTVAYSEPLASPISTLMMTFGAGMTIPRIEILTAAGQLHELPPNDQVREVAERYAKVMGDLLSGYATTVRAMNKAAREGSERRMNEGGGA